MSILDDLQLVRLDPFGGPTRKPIQFFVDMDDVLNKFTSSVGHYWGVAKDMSDLSWYDPAHGFNVYEAVTQALSAKGVKMRHNMPEFWDCLKHEFWARVPVSDIAIDMLEGLASLAGPENVFIATSPTKCPRAASGKVDWINTKMPEWIRRQYFITPRKWELSAPGRLLIDDHIDNCLKWAQLGGTAGLIEKPWNYNWRAERGLV